MSILAAQAVENSPSALLSVAFLLGSGVLLGMAVLWWRRLGQIREGAPEINSLGETQAPHLRPVKDRAMLVLFVVVGLLFLYAGAKGLWSGS